MTLRTPALLTPEPAHGLALVTRVTAGIGSRALATAVAQELGTGATVIGWSARSVSVARTTDTGFAGPDDRPVDTSDWFALRAFNAERDARWAAQGVDDGTLVVVSETTDPTTAGVIPVAARITGVRYLLVGERNTEGDDWAVLSSANTGPLRVPDPGGSGRIALQAVEYVVFDNDGNADVVDERLVGLTNVEVG